MKKILLLSILVLLVSTGFAQGLKVTDEGLDNMVLAVALDGPAMANLEMQQELKLTEAQYAEVEKLNATRYKQITEAEESLADNPVVLSKTIYSINLLNDKALMSVLDEKQLRQYLELEGRNNIRYVSDNNK